MVSIAAARVAPRRSLTLPLRFTRLGRVCSAVSVNVSATGMYVRASDIPSAGELIRLTLIPKHGAVRAEIFGEVRWGRRTPSLDDPEPGFGLHFIEIACVESDKEGLVRLLSNLGIEQPEALIQVETRHNARLAVHRFP